MSSGRLRHGHDLRHARASASGLFAVPVWILLFQFSGNGVDELFRFSFLSHFVGFFLRSAICLAGGMATR